MAEEQENFEVEKSEVPVQQENGQTVIDESNYKVHAAPQRGPAAVGRGGDPFYKRIRASQEQINELLQETMTVQDWIQRETCNNVALTCLQNENLKEVYFQIKDGFGDYGPILLMGFKTPQGVEIPRLKVLDKEGEVIEVLTGPFAIDELNKRALAYKALLNEYSPVDAVEEVQEVLTDYQDEYMEDYKEGEIQDYTGNV